MADYKYEAETIRIMELSSAIKVISEHVDEFSHEIETEDVLKLQRQLKNAVKTADRIVEHLSSLNTKEDREAYIKAQKQKERAEKVSALLQSSNVLEYVSIEQTATTEENESNPYDSYGWVRPDGNFISSDYGTHEESAIEIVKEMGWRKEHKNSVYSLCRDFLVYVKGYALIHNPSMDGGYIVTHNPAKNLTKAQRATLFDYFTYNNDSFLANRYGIDEKEMER